MIVFKNQIYKDFGEIYKNFNLCGLSQVLGQTRASLKRFNDVVSNLGIKSENGILKPSDKIVKFYTSSDAQKIIEKLNADYKNEKVPDNYISKKELITWLEITDREFIKIYTYAPSLKNYSRYFFINNVKTKFFLFDSKSQIFYLEKKNLFKEFYKKAYRKYQEIEIEENTEAENKIYIKGSHHKIVLDYTMLNKLFDTSSSYFKELIRIYKKYAAFQVADSEIMDCHHIIPRFISNYKHLWDMENTIYLRVEIHLLVHILEYRCALPEFKSKFFGAFAILTARTDESKINENALNEVMKGLIKTLDNY